LDKLKTQEFMGYAFVFMAGALWGTIGLFIKQMQMCGADSMLVSFLRVFFAFGIMLVITLLRCGWKSFLIKRNALISSALLGIVCHGIYNIFYCYAVEHAGVTISAVLLNVAPVFTFVVSAICFSERANTKKAIALILNVIGCILAATGGTIHVETLAVTGLLCGVGAGICYGMTAIFGRFAAESTDPFVMSTYSYLFASLMLVVPARPWENAALMMNHRLLFYGMLLALIPTAIGYVLYYYGLQQITESSKVPVIASVETVVAAVLGIAVYHEMIGCLNIVGMVVVLFSICLMNWKV